MASKCLLLFRDGLWMLAGVSWRLLDACCYLLDGFWVLLAISWRLLDACYDFLIPSGCLLLFPRGFSMLAVICWRLPGACCDMLEGPDCLLFACFPIDFCILAALSCNMPLHKCDTLHEDGGELSESTSHMHEPREQETVACCESVNLYQRKVTCVLKLLTSHYKVQDDDKSDLQ